ncbi:MAG: GNAT family N-acetyltransferase [Actinomycetota bacterium]
MPRTARRLEAGDRVYLRAPTARDERTFLKLARASKRLHRNWVFAPATPKAFRDYLGQMRKRNARALIVCRREDDAMVGVFNLSQIVRGPLLSAYLGYWSFAPHAGRGYMTEGLCLVLRHAFGPMGLHRLEANIQPANTRSKALVQRCGFRLEGFSPRYVKLAGRWRGHERWAITVEETR